VTFYSAASRARNCFYICPSGIQVMATVRPTVCPSTQWLPWERDKPDMARRWPKVGQFGKVAPTGGSIQQKPGLGTQNWGTALAVFNLRPKDSLTKSDNGARTLGHKWERP
jgi:hypothetical protein